VTATSFLLVMEQQVLEAMEMLLMVPQVAIEVPVTVVVLI
jgi:hypothetical protein